MEQQGEIDTPVDTMSWAYYQYVKAHPIEKWTVPTFILYGAKDNLQSQRVIEDFAERFLCNLTLAENSEHPFMAEEDVEIVAEWMKSCI